MISVAEAVSFITLTVDEQQALQKLESVVDATLYKSFDGAPFSINLPETVPQKVAYALQRRYEERGGWRVSVARRRVEGVESTEFGFVPIFYMLAKPPTVAKQQVEQNLPAVPVLSAPARLTSAAPTANLRLLVRMPTRGRPQQAINVLTKYRNMAGCSIEIEVVVDEDDESMLDSRVMQRLVALDCTVTVGKHYSKVEACNGGSASDWDVLVLASDDMVPVRDGWAVEVINAMERCWPHLDGAIYFDDGHQKDKLCTLPIIGRRLYEHYHFIYDPHYRSLFCDREQTDLWRERGRLMYIPGAPIVEHRHHAWGLAEKDDLYKRNDALEDRDRAMYQMRRSIRRSNSQFFFDQPPLWLSVCICTLPARRDSLRRLVSYLYAQILSPSFENSPREVEILVDDREGISIGEKRRDMLTKSKGYYVAFVDDDDWVSHDYVSRVLGAIKSDPEADCTSLRGVLTTLGEAPEAFHHSLQYTGWYTDGGVHRRSPNHLNAVRREIALLAGFTNKSHGEDFDYSTKLREYLKREVDTGSAPLYFYWYDPTKSVASPR